MSSSNPKVSAYVPKNIFDIFRHFYVEKNMSMSQAVTVIFSEYFQVEPHQSLPSGLLSSRVEKLEYEISALSSLDHASLSKLLVRVKFLEDALSKFDSSLGIKPLSELSMGSLSSEPQVDENDSSQDTIIKSLKTKPEIPKSLQLFPDDIGRNTDFNTVDTLNGTQLAKRLGISQSMISKYKEINGLAEWSKRKDPQAIAWSYNSVSKKFSPIKPAGSGEAERAGV